MLSNNYIDPELRITIGEIGASIAEMIDRGEIDATSKVLWASQVSKGSIYERENNALPGSILFGLEWVEDGEVARGTLRLEPKLITSRIN